jgi:hypothetical protein
VPTTDQRDQLRRAVESVHLALEQRIGTAWMQAIRGAL